jgi:large conductance mechanosensitive channel
MTEKKTGFFKEFRAFIERGSAIDMAVGIIVGSVMTGMVDSLVKDIIMPPIGLFIGGVDFSQIFITIGPGKDGAFFYNTVAAAQAAGATTLNIGMFLNAFISFMITMFAVFLLVRIVNKTRGQKPAKTRICPYCKTSIDRMATKCPNCCSDVVPLLSEKAVDSCKKSNKGLVCKIKKIIR